MFQSKAKTILLKFKSTQISWPRHATELHKAIKWKLPTSPQYKINFDEAIFKEQGAATLGVVIRDLQGLVIGALLEHIVMPMSTTTVKALASRRALTFAKELSIFNSKLRVMLKLL